MSNVPKIMVVGAGDIGTRVFYELAHASKPRNLLLCGRNQESVIRFANMTRFSAIARGYQPSVSALQLDLNNIDHTATQISDFAPDIIFAAASIQPWWALFQLPQEKFDALYKAAYGPWLPFHLAPVAKLMRAVKQSSTKAVVVNAAYPDAVHPILVSAGLSPQVGIGNVANNVPGLRVAAAEHLEARVDEISVRLVAHHFVSHVLSRKGSSVGAKYDLRIYRDGKRISLDETKLFQSLLSTHRRTGGLPGQAMTAASALSVLEALADGTERLLHAPGPHGLAGGYPIRIKGGVVELDLDPELRATEAIDINTHGQSHDGIANINSDGFAEFEDWSVDVMKRELGYYCKKMSWNEAEDYAVELRRKFAEYRGA
jgi:hypothetical protein